MIVCASFLQIVQNGQFHKRQRVSTPLEPKTPARLAPALAADPLGDVLHLLRLSGTFYCVPELTAPWGIAVPDLEDQLVLVAVTEGQCLLDLESGTRFHLRPGQLVLLPHGRPVDMKSSGDSRLTPLFDIPATRHTPHFETMAFGGGGALTRMTCGVLRVDHAAAGYLVSLLPEAIFLDGFEPASGSWVQSTLAYLAEEARHPKPGGETVLTRLTDILVVQAIRPGWKTERHPERGGLPRCAIRKSAWRYRRFTGRRPSPGRLKPWRGRRACRVLPLPRASRN